MKKLFLFIFVFVSASGLCQLRVSEREAILVAVRTMEMRGYADCQSLQVFYDISNEGDTLLFEVVMSNGYSVLVSGSKKCMPVLAVYKRDMRQTVFFDDERNPIVVMYHRIVEDQMTSNYQQIPSELWNALLDTTSLLQSLRSPSFLLTSEWGEDKSNDGIDLTAYNAECPYIDDCQSLAGSAAVAMGQLMYYWNYPFFSLNQGYTPMWCNMDDVLITTDNCYNIKKKNISTLLELCGNVALSNYSCSYTSTYSDDVIEELNDYFFYNTETQFERTPYFPTPGMPENAGLFQLFWNKLQRDIDRGRPIIGYLKDDENKFYFICDGYSSSYYIHINWGAGNGQLNGEYSIVNARELFFLFDIRPQIEYSVGEHLSLSNYYNYCASSAGNLPLYSIVPYTTDTITSADASTDTSWRTIPNSAGAIYQAHEEINLKDGFEAKYGCEFEARIVPCTQCENNQRGSFSSNDVLIDDSVGNQPSFIDNEEFYAVGKSGDFITIDLFPNPTDGPLTMATEGMAEEVFVHDLFGRLVGGWDVNALTENYVTLDVSALHSGPYLLTVTTSSGTCTARFLRK